MFGGDEVKKNEVGQGTECACRVLCEMQEAALESHVCRDQNGHRVKAVSE